MMIRTEKRRACVEGGLVWVGLSFLAGGSAWGAGLPIEFELSSGSGVRFSELSVEGRTSGSLIGDWNAVSNPTGTRTKPGIFGSFSSTENVAVPSLVNLRGSGAPVLSLGGGLRMELDVSGGGGVLVSGYEAAKVAGPGSDGVGLSARVVFESFRTRQPSSTYPGGIPVTLPIGDVSVRSLVLRQVGGGGGTLTDLGAGRYGFNSLLVVEVSGLVEGLGTALPFGPLVTPLGLIGEVEVMGGAAVLRSVSGLSVADSQVVGQAFPALPFELPTVLPAGGTANVVFNLTLEEVIATLTGEVSTLASGTVVPEPGALVWAMAAGVLLGVRRR